MSVFDEAKATITAWERLQAWGGWPAEWDAENLPRFFWSAMDRLMLAVVAEAEERSERDEPSPVGWAKANGCGEIIFRQAGHTSNDERLGPEWYPVFMQAGGSR